MARIAAWRDKNDDNDDDEGGEDEEDAHDDDNESEDGDDGGSDEDDSEEKEDDNEDDEDENGDEVIQRKIRVPKSPSRPKRRYNNGFKTGSPTGKSGNVLKAGSSTPGTPKQAATRPGTGFQGLSTVTSLPRRRSQFELPESQRPALEDASPYTPYPANSPSSRKKTATISVPAKESSTLPSSRPKSHACRDTLPTRSPILPSPSPKTRVRKDARSTASRAPSASKPASPRHETVEALGTSLGNLHLGPHTPTGQQDDAELSGDTETDTDTDVDTDSIPSVTDILYAADIRQVETKLRAALRKRVNSTGSVYILTSASKPGLVKIGRAKNPAVRIRNMRSLCKLPDLKIEYMAKNLEQPTRVEALVHGQLSLFKRPLSCVCGVFQHREWFQCSVEVAIEVVDAWAGWMRRNPYVDLELRAQWSDRVPDLKLRRGAEETFEELFRRHSQWIEQAS